MAASSPSSPAKVSVLTATLIVISNMIGVGVFTSLGFQVGSIPSGFPILLLWGIGGLVALCGALSYAELSAALPRSGGEYHFLSKVYHPALGFLAGWLSMTVGFAAPVALAAMAFAEYFAGSVAELPKAAVACTVVICVTALHLVNLKFSAGFHTVFTVLKVVLIILLIGAGFSQSSSEAISFLPQTGDLDLVFQPAFAISLIYVLYSYEGWNAAAYIAGEVKNPGRNVPLALLAGTICVILLYLGVNAAFLHTTPLKELENQPEIGLIAARHIFGENGGRLMGGLIAFGLISSVSGMAWAGSRVSQTVGSDHSQLGFLSRTTRHGVPAAALLLQMAIVLGLVLTASFRAVLVYIQMLLILSSTLTVIGLFVLRIRQPDLHRPYRTWGYPFTPAFFVACNTLVLLYTISENPKKSLIGLCTIGLGALVYYIPLKLKRNGPRLP